MQDRYYVVMSVGMNYNATALTIHCIVQELSRGKEAALEQERERLKTEHSMEVAMFLCVFVFVFVFVFVYIYVCEYVYV